MTKQPFLTDIQTIRERARQHIAIDGYCEIVAHLGDQDPTSRRIMEDILAQQEEHADGMAGLLEGLQRQHQSNA